MDYKQTAIYRLICEKASFDTLRKAQQIIALCQICYCLEEDRVGDAINIYTAWEKAYPEGVECDETPISSQEIDAIPHTEFNCLPWIYVNTLETMCADKEVPEDGEITAETVLKVKVNYSWRLDNSLITKKDSFFHNYNAYMYADWVKEFLEKMKIVWPLTSAAEAAKAEEETLADSDTEFDELPIPLLPSSPQAIHDVSELPSFFTLEPEKVISTIQSVPQAQQEDLTEEQKKKKLIRQAEHYWPFMRCKNIYKAYGGTGRLSHYNLLKWVAGRVSVKLENMKYTDPYTIKWLQGLPKRW
jgi:hypothetical protein